MMLRPEDQSYIARRAQWYFDVAVSPRMAPLAWGDNCTFTGQGLKDLNQTIDFLRVNPQTRVMCEVGSTGTIMLGNAWPKYLPCDIEDVYAIKDFFIAYYGSVDRPSCYRDTNSAAMQVDSGKVVPPVELSGTVSVLNSPYDYEPVA